MYYMLHIYIFKFYVFFKNKFSSGKSFRLPSESRLESCGTKVTVRYFTVYPFDVFELSTTVHKYYLKIQFKMTLLKTSKESNVSQKSKSSE